VHDKKINNNISILQMKKLRFRKL